MAPASQAPVISKWSLKPQNHNATRVRDNQRRHRARVKARIESLEMELTQSRQELRMARARIQELEALLTDGDSSHTLSSHFNGLAREPAGQPNQITTKEALPVEEFGSSGGAPGGLEPCQYLPSSTSQPSGEQHHDQRAAPSLAVRVSNTDPMMPSSLLSDESVASPVIFSIIAQYSRDDRLPLVAPGESTILCRVAYEMVSQQSMASLDFSDFEEWLRPGFRREIKPGEGCRVDTKILYGLIDCLSPL